MVRSATAELPSSVPATLCDVAAGLAAHGTRTALIDFRDGRPVELSYAALGERIIDTALRLHAAGIGRGSCVAIWAPNSAAWVIGYFGAVRAGATVVPIDQQSMPTTRGRDPRARGRGAAAHDRRSPRRSFASSAAAARLCRSRAVGRTTRGRMAGAVGGRERAARRSSPTTWPRCSTRRALPACRRPCRSRIATSPPTQSR